MTIAQEEIFGPVLSIIPYDDEDDAVRIANDTSTAWPAASGRPTRTAPRRVARRIRTGQVEVNGGAFNPTRRSAATSSRATAASTARYGLEEFLETKSMQL